MEAEENRKIDRMVKKMVSEVGTEEVSENFTDAVMRRIDLSGGKKYVYSPLINTMTWRIIGVVIAAICLLLLTGQWEISPSNIHIPFLSQVTDWNLSKLYTDMNLKLKDNIGLHPTIWYSLLMLSFFMYIQILLLGRKLR